MKFAFVFPGQGSQSIGMMGVYGNLPGIRETFAEASDVLGQDLWRLVTEGPVEELNQTVNTQPVMLTAGVAVWRAWNAAGGLAPVVLAGHSLGEYSALVASGALAFADALPLVRFRAQAMQEAVAEGVGAMAAVLGLDEAAVTEVCAEAAQGEVLEAVNLNSPGQIVIAGNRAAVERGMQAAKAKGAKRAMLLPVSVPSHCALMRPAAERLQEYLESVAIAAPAVPVVHNADVDVHNDAAGIREALVKQLYRPVRWIETVRSFSRWEVTHNVECGPGKVLAGLNKRIDDRQQALALADQATLGDIVALKGGECPNCCG